MDILLALPSAPDLSVGITHTGSFAQGQSGATYSITVSNIGYAPTSGTVSITDSLPSGVVAMNISGTGWNCLLGTLTCTRGDPLAALASYPTITLTVSVAANAPSGVTNTVSVSGGGETNAAGDTAGDYTTTFTPAQVSQNWSTLLHPPPADLVSNAPLLMTDGTVIVQQYCSGNWYRLTPDVFGNYVNGTWSQLPSMPPGYGPYAFSSAVLADGRVVVIGGEYNEPSCKNQIETNLGAIYDPLANTWTPLSPPAGWDYVGDAQNTVLPDGQLLLTTTVSDRLAKLDPTTLIWTHLKGSGKADYYNEEGWTLLPDGSVLTIDVDNGTHSERYFPQTDTWTSAGNTVAPLAALSEIGPQVLRPDGTVFVAGATGHTGVYNVASGTWSAGPDFPVSNGIQIYSSDRGAVLLPNGNVLTSAAFAPSMFEFDGTHLNPVVPAPGNCDSPLLLPTGQVWCGYQIYTPTGSPNPAWAPTIATAPNVVKLGSTYPITGTQFNGLSQAVGFGDDYQGATNYPLVRITNTATGHVFYARTHNHSTMGVATGSAIVSTQFDVPTSIELGPSTLVVVANGIASKPWNLSVSPADDCNYSLNLSGQAFTAQGGTGTFTITTGANCPWTVGTLPAGVTLTSAGSGTGSGNVTFQVAPNGGGDVSRSFTIAGQTFTIEQSAASIAGLAAAGSLGQVASEGTWDFSLIGINLGASAATARFSFADNNGSPLMMPLTFPQLPGAAGPELASTLDRTLSPNAQIVMNSTGPDSAATLIGSGQLLSNGNVSGFGIFANPKVKWNAVVPLETRNASKYILAFDNTLPLTTGVAVANLAAQAANVPVIIRDDSGTPIGNATISLSALGHTSFMLNDPQLGFPVTNGARGTVEFDTPPGGQISVLGLRANGPALTTLPVLANVGTSGGSITHVAVNGGWTSVFYLVNTGSALAQFTLSFFDENGVALPVPLFLPQSGTNVTTSALTQTLAAGAMLVVNTQAQDSQALVIGSAQLTTTGNISGFEIFRWTPFGQEASVPLETRTPNSFVLVFDNTNGLTTGVALANLNAAAANVTVRIYDDAGSPLQTTSINLEAAGTRRSCCRTAMP